MTYNHAQRYAYQIIIKSWSRYFHLYIYIYIYIFQYVSAFTKLFNKSRQLGQLIRVCVYDFQLTHQGFSQCADYVLITISLLVTICAINLHCHATFQRTTRRKPMTFGNLVLHEIKYIHNRQNLNSRNWSRLYKRPDLVVVGGHRSDD